MPKVTVDHNGMTEGHYYTKDVPVELPADVVEALGDSAVPCEGEAKKSSAPVKKEVKKVQNKMVQKADVTTKAEDAKTVADPAAQEEADKKAAAELQAEVDAKAKADAEAEASK